MKATFQFITSDSSLFEPRPVKLNRWAIISFF